MVKSKEVTAKIIGVRMTQRQIDHIEKRAIGGSISEYIREVIDKDIKRAKRAKKGASNDKKKLGDT